MVDVDILVFVCHHGLIVEAVGEGESAVTPKVFRSYWLGSILLKPFCTGTRLARTPHPENKLIMSQVQMRQTLHCLMHGDGDKTWWTKEDYIRRQWLQYCKNCESSRIEWWVWLAGSSHGEGSRRNLQGELEVYIRNA